VHDRVDVPAPPVMVAGVAVHDRLVEFDVTPSVTAPENPFTGTTVTVEMLAELAILVTAVGLAFTVKS